MLKNIIGLLITFISASAAAKPQERIEIDSKSLNRVVCNVRFANVEGLKIVATRVPELRWKTRVDIERYSACPYDVTMKYQGFSLRIDFSTSINREMIKNYEPGMEVNTGLFRLDSEGWIANGELISSPNNKINVEETDQEVLITGISNPVKEKGQPAYVCFSMALIGKQGFLTGGLCSNKHDAALTFGKLFGKKQLISTN
jgi:hypothetical protein